VVGVPGIALSLVEPGQTPWIGRVLVGWLIVVIVSYVAVEIRAGYRESIDQ